MSKKENRGGARKGAGRPKKELTVVLYKRVPKSLYKRCLEAVLEILNLVG